MCLYCTHLGSNDAQVDCLAIWDTVDLTIIPTGCQVGRSCRSCTCVYVLICRHAEMSKISVHVICRACICAYAFVTSHAYMYVCSDVCMHASGI